MESPTDTTVTTETVGEAGALDLRESNAPALMFIGYGIAMLSAGQWMLEEGIKRAGGWKGIRQMLTRVERTFPVLEDPPAQVIEEGASANGSDLSPSD